MTALTLKMQNTMGLNIVLISKRHVDILLRHIEPLFYIRADKFPYIFKSA